MFPKKNIISRRKKFLQHLKFFFIVEKKGKTFSLLDALEAPINNSNKPYEMTEEKREWHKIVTQLNVHTPFIQSLCLHLLSPLFYCHPVARFSVCYRHCRSTHHFSSHHITISSPSSSHLTLPHFTTTTTPPTQNVDSTLSLSLSFVRSFVFNSFTSVPCYVSYI